MLRNHRHFLALLPALLALVLLLAPTPRAQCADPPADQETPVEPENRRQEPRTPFTDLDPAAQTVIYSLVRLMGPSCVSDKMNVLMAAFVRKDYDTAIRILKQGRWNYDPGHKRNEGHYLETHLKQPDRE